jgi:hypothetical protein
MLLLNIDRPLKSATLHAPACDRVPRPFGTQHKPVEELGRDGGWFKVMSQRDAEQMAFQLLPGAAFVECHYCLGAEELQPLLPTRCVGIPSQAG